MRREPEWREIFSQWAGEKDQTHREKKLHEWLQPILDKYFHVIHEAEGTSLRDGAKRRIDFLCKPRKITLSTNFPDCIFGIEAKWPDAWGKTAPITKWIRQCVDYRHCAFRGSNGETVYTPAFILSVPPVSHLVDETAGIDVGNFVTRLGYQLGIGELNPRPRRAYDPCMDLTGQSYDTVLQVCFDMGTCYWINAGRPRNKYFGNHLLGETK